MKKAIIFLILTIFLVSGCQIGREIGATYCEESKLNTAAIRMTGNCILEAWPSRYPLYEAFKPQLNQQTIEAINILNELSAMDPNERTDEHLGRAVIRGVQVKYDFMKLGVSEYFPEALRYLP